MSMPARKRKIYLFMNHRKLISFITVPTEMTKFFLIVFFLHSVGNIMFFFAVCRNFDFFYVKLFRSNKYRICTIRKHHDSHHIGQLHTLVHSQYTASDCDFISTVAKGLWIRHVGLSQLENHIHVEYSLFCGTIKTVTRGKMVVKRHSFQLFFRFPCFAQNTKKKTG